VDIMARLPRLALATQCDAVEPSLVSLAMLAGLGQIGVRAQHFRCLARPFGTTCVRQASGLPGRHLDAWLMSPETLRCAFSRGAKLADLSLIEGTLAPRPHGLGPYPHDQPGPLAPIAEALDLPRVAVVDCGGVSGPVCLTRPPCDFDAIILDNLGDPTRLESARVCAKHMFRKPVLAVLDSMPEIREFLKARSTQHPIPSPILDRLAASFLRNADLGAIRSLADSRPYQAVTDAACPCASRRFRVAYANDDAFGGYFPDTLETLQAFGAELVDFSPLKDEALPSDVDLVMIGCGSPDQYLDALAANLSLIGALRQYVCRGNRLYAEGGGTAYLGRSMIVDGRSVPGAGILPLDAILRSDQRSPVPVRRVLSRESWIGGAGTELRGYRSGRWTLRPAEDPHDCPTLSGTLTAQKDMYFRKLAVGSLIHFHLASFPRVISAFAGAPRSSFTLPRPSNGK
jgi:cobyrinic acid a,c-diamide synthase